MIAPQAAATGMAAEQAKPGATPNCVNNIAAT